MSLTEKQLELAKRFGFGNSHNTKLVKRKRPTRKAAKPTAIKPKATKALPASYDSWDSKAPFEFQASALLIARIFDISNNREKKEVLSLLRPAVEEYNNGDRNNPAYVSEHPVEALKGEYLGLVERLRIKPSLAGFKRFILAK